MMDVPRFDHLWRKADEAYDQFTRRRNDARRAIRQARRYAYRFAKNILLIQEHWHNEFLAQVASAGMDVDRWLDEHFDPIEQMGQTRTQLFADIRDGMTEKQYVAHGNLWGPKKRATATGDMLTTSDTPTKVDLDSKVSTDDLSVEQKLAFYEQRIAALEAELRESRQDRAFLAAALEEANRREAKMERVLRSKRKVG
jgi:hypothetical protein